MKHTVVEIKEGNVIESLQRFLKQLLEARFVDTLLVPKMLPGRDSFVQTLIRDSAMLKDSNPIAPTMAVQSAQILSKLTSGDFDGRIGVVIKPCELRAAVELSKFLQVNLDNVVTIGVDCCGTYEVKNYAAMSEEERAASAKTLMNGNGNDSIREACQICEHPAPINADITIGLFNSDSAQGVSIIIGERFEKELADKLSLHVTDGLPKNREEAVTQVINKRRETREKASHEITEQLSGIDKLLEVFSTCIRCYNCMNVCPICYCKECVFRSPVFEHRSDQLLKLADRKGAIRMPSDTLIFHITRLTHMATSCVGCGMCDSACPNGLPVSRLFNMIGSELQGMFEYVPGRDINEDAPVTVFKEDELKEESGSGG